MQSYTARYNTFVPPQRPKSSKAPLDPRWPHPDTYLATPASLAAAGFYFNPSSETPDAVSCYICDKGLADWDPEDDPAQIHAQKCPKCAWAILKCITDTKRDGDIVFTSPSRLPASRAMEKARLATFGSDAKKWWPHDAKNKGPTSKMMAKAGFVYTPSTPKDDTCTCIYCGIELGGWQSEDDPTEEHRSRQAKHGPCPFFIYTDPVEAQSPAKQRTRSKSKPPPTTPIASDDEYQPPGTRSSTRAVASSASSKKPGSSTKSSKPQSSKKSSKAKTIEEEVIEEYHVALDEDEDAPPKPRPKPRRASSRSRSGSRSGSGATESAVSRGRSKGKSKLVEEVEDPQPARGRSKSKSKFRPKDQEKTEETRSDPSPQRKAEPVSKRAAVLRGNARIAEVEVNDKPLRPASEPRREKTKAKPSGPKRAAQSMEQLPEEDVLRLKPQNVSRQSNQAPVPAHTLSQTNGLHHGVPPGPVPSPPRPQFKSFQSPEDEEFAREEQALEEQARELMLADGKLTLTVTPSPPSLGNGRSAERHSGVKEAMRDISIEKPHRRRLPDKGKGKAKASPAEDVDDSVPPGPVSTPPPHPGIANKTRSPSTVKFPQIVPEDTLTSLTDTERAMTVEEWVRHEMDRQYEKLRTDGRQKIDAFIARAAEVGRQIESL